MKWEIETSEYIYEHKPYCTLRKDKCIKPDKKIVDAYYVVELPPSVIIFGITENEKVIFIKQYRHPIQEVTIELPGGFVDENEDFEVAAKREAEEETGYTFKTITYLEKIAANPGILNNYTHIYIATGGVKEKAVKFDDNEDIETLLLDIDEAASLLKDGKIVQALHAMACMYALAHLQKITFA